MPIYDFVCLDCKKQFERLVLSEGEKVACDCGSASVEKKPSVFSVAGAVSSQYDLSSGSGSCGGSGGFS